MGNRRIVLISSALAIVAIPALAIVAPRVRHHTESQSCANQMSSIGTVARLWADEHHGQMPSDLYSMSNILNTPQIFACPGDHTGHVSDTWATFTPSNCSYEIVAPGISKNVTNTAFLRCRVHGYLVYSDGTVSRRAHRHSK
jgi:hypothetical protein